MITIGYCTRKVEAIYKKYLKTSCGLPNVEVISFKNEGTHSLTEAYNILLDKAKYDIVILCHDDIYFDTENWGHKIIEHFYNTDYGILGVAGTKKLSPRGVWWVNETCGIVNHINNNQKVAGVFGKEKEGIVDVEAIDGLFIAINKKRINKRFNEDFKGYHYYDVDFSYNNHINGTKVGVTLDIRITHLSRGNPNEEWERNRRQFVKTYKLENKIYL